MSEKKIRTLETVHIELSEAAQKIGLLQYQLDREIPRELEKLMNVMHDLEKEGRNLVKAHQEHEAKMKANGVATLEIPHDGETIPDLTVVQ